MSEPSYPRGIINPNYPGFQHLAHTLSEHFIDHHQQFGNMSDSDVSEVESDIPNDKQADAIDCVDENSNNNNNIKNFDDDNGNTERRIEINSNKITIDNGNRNISVDANLSKVEEILRTVFESNSSHLRTAIESFTEYEPKTPWFGINHMETECDPLTMMNDNDFVDASSEIIACDLKTYLKRYDEVSVNLDVHSICKNCDKLTPDEPPPDIIQKSTSCDTGFDTKADKPDILQNVALDATGVNMSPGQHEKEESGSHWGITPVDIVGNFEQEVERELGLLINGYKNNNSASSDGQTILVDHSMLERRNGSDKVIQSRSAANDIQLLCMHYEYGISNIIRFAMQCGALLEAQHFRAIFMSN